MLYLREASMGIVPKTGELNVNELVNFGAFMALAWGGHSIGHWLESHPNFCPRMRAKATGRILGMATAVTVHPTTIEAFKEYMVHLVVYSGYVLGHH